MLSYADEPFRRRNALPGRPARDLRSAHITVVLLTSMVTFMLTSGSLALSATHKHSPSSVAAAKQYDPIRSVVYQESVEHVSLAS